MSTMVVVGHHLELEGGIIDLLQQHSEQPSEARHRQRGYLAQQSQPKNPQCGRREVSHHMVRESTWRMRGDSFSQREGTVQRLSDRATGDGDFNTRLRSRLSNWKCSWGKTRARCRRVTRQIPAAKGSRDSRPAPDSCCCGTHRLSTACHT